MRYYCNQHVGTYTFGFYRTPEVVIDSGANARDMLVKGSVVSATKAQYVSGMKTIAKFLRVQRGCPDVDPESCTEEEFLQFLLSRKKDDFVDPETFRSALLWYQEAHTTHRLLAYMGGTSCTS